MSTLRTPHKTGRVAAPAEGVVLAAGTSYRAGTFKPALQLGDRTMIARCLAGMESFCSRIIVVGGHEYEQLRSLVEGIPKVECVENAAYQRGMFTSVKLGLLHTRRERIFLLPADIPLVPPHVYQRLLDAGVPVAVPVWNGRKGHPVLLSKSVVPRILSEPDTSSLRDVLQAIGVKEIAVDTPEILLDVDTPGDYEEILKRIH